MSLPLFLTWSDLRNVGSPIVYTAVIQIRKHIFDEKDTSKKCINYPNEKYRSYSECDDTFIKNIIPAGLNPFWTVENINDATKEIFIEDIPQIYEDLADGTYRSPCPLPCTIININSRTIHKTASSTNYSTVDLTFDQSVQLTATTFVKFSFSDFLSSVGGSMGLWLGLGLLQATELLVQSITNRVQKSNAWIWGLGSSLFDLLILQN